MIAIVIPFRGNVQKELPSILQEISTSGNYKCGSSRPNLEEDRKTRKKLITNSAVISE